MLSFFEGDATIFMLHRVFPRDANKLSANENLKVSPEFLERFIVSALGSGYSFISLDELHSSLLKSKGNTKSIVITLDDGYADNLIYAYPIFKKYNIPFAIYLTTAFPNRTALLWWYLLEDLIVENDTINLADGLHFQCGKKWQKEAAFMAIRDKIINLPKQSFIDSLNRLFVNLQPDWQQKISELAISWDQLKTLCKSPLVTIGAHTKNHHSLTKLTENQIIDEVIGSKAIIESKLGTSVKHFCYPFGGQNEAGVREFKLIKELGFDTAVTTRFGNIFPEHSAHLTSLPRVMLTDNFSWATFHFRSFKQMLKGRVVSV
ncbi:polysaccharide deacetylase family protein [Methylomonas koyamae]|uniref:polysaccharide deacetylase family protein n=1 Tax=Methylomonas koyamae TaxID=702114 RepID=UPI0006D151F4|nr:polysaccharide deacetylase family protein [Methylomonas koyamae]BBL59015.1 hypothetical protein MKFW12EY_26280 [Methylomonas koyamae]